MKSLVFPHIIDLYGVIL